MFIKQPTSDMALESLWKRMDFARDRLTNCVGRNHDATVVLYISSLIISPTVVYDNRELLNEIANLIALSPRRCICVVRTTTSNYFPGSMKNLQQRSIDFLRDKCYVVLYSPRHEFLKHAKFFIHYHVCLSEKIVYNGKYYGSTNFTERGLGNPRSRGNYEEFMTNQGMKFSLSRGDEFYLSEVLDLIKHRTSLYTDPQYLAKYLSDHQTSLETLLYQGRELTPNSTVEVLYETYVNSLVAYSQTFAMLDEVPGKKITLGIIEKLASTRPPPNPFEIEMMSVDTKYASLMTESLELDKSDLLRFLRENMYAIENGLEMIKRNYQPLTKEISDYLDEREDRFKKFLGEYSETHATDLEKMKVLIQENRRFS